MKKVLSIFIACIMTITMVSCSSKSNKNEKDDSKKSDSLPIATLKSEGPYNGNLVNTTWLVPVCVVSQIHNNLFYEFSFTENSMKIQEYCYSWDSENFTYPSEIKTETVPCVVTDSEIQFDEELINSYNDSNKDLYMFLRYNLNLRYASSDGYISLYYDIIDSVAFLSSHKAKIRLNRNINDYFDEFNYCNSDVSLSMGQGLVMYYKHTEYSNDELLEFLDGAWVGTKTEDIDESQDFEAQCTNAFEINSNEKSVVFSKGYVSGETTDELPLIDYISDDITGAIGYVEMVNAATDPHEFDKTEMIPWPSHMFVEIIDEQTIRILWDKDSIYMYTFKRTDSMPQMLIGHIRTANRNAKTAYNAISAFAQKCDTAGKKLCADGHIISPIITIDTSDRSSPKVYNITSAVAGSNELADGAEEELSNALSQSFSDESDGASVIIIFNKDGYPQKVYYADKDSEFVGCYPDELTEKTSGGIKTYLN